MESDEWMKEIEKLADLESQLMSLRERDTEIAFISKGLSMRTKILKLQDESHQLRSALTHQTELNDALMKTVSWRITKPLRFVRTVIRRFLK